MSAPRRWLPLLVVAAVACGDRPRDRIERPGHPDFLLERKDDAEMAAAIARARETLPQLVAALSAPRPGREGFAVKKRYEADGKREYVWHTDPVVLPGRGFLATVANAPVWIASVRPGQRTLVADAEVADWMFLEDGRLVGGYTLRVLCAREPPEGRKKLERELGAAIPPPER